MITLAVAAGRRRPCPISASTCRRESGRAIQRLASVTLFAAVNRLAGLRRLEDPAFQDRLRLAQQAGRSGPGQVFTNSIGIVQSAILTLAGSWSR